MKKPVYIIGAAGQAREIYDYLIALGWTGIVFAVDDEYIEHSIDLPAKVIPISTLQDERAIDVVIGVGAPTVKRAMVGKLKDANFVKVLSSESFIGQNVQIGDGSVVAPMAVITNNTKIGEHVSVNIGATISHDCVIGDFATISPGAHLAGRVELGDGVFVGIGAVIKNGIKVASGCVIGAGAVVVEDITEPNTVVIGNPAKKLKINADWLDEI